MTTMIDTTDSHAEERTTTTALADLRAAHLEIAALVAELDLDDTGTWATADPVIASAAAAAYDMTAALTGQPTRHIAHDVPPVVRARELAVAQRQLTSALDAKAAPDRWLAEHVRESADHVSRLAQSLGGRSHPGEASSRR